MPKKSNTRRADGRIAVQVYLGRENGKRMYKTVYGKTQKEAEQKAADLKATLKKGIDLTESNTFSFWADRFLSVKKSSVSYAWHLCLQSRFEYLKSYFGNQSPEKIKLYDAQMFINEIAQCNPSTGKPSSKKTLTEYVSLLKQFYNYLIANRIVEYNPMQMLTVPKSAPQSKRNALTKDQRQWVINTPHRAQTAAMIMMFAGLRRGELNALQWDDIDFAHNTITVSKGYDFKANKVKSTKTEAGMRKIIIPDILSEYLRHTNKKSRLVVPNTKGDYMTESSWRRLWTGYMRTLNKKYGDFSDMHIKGNRESLPMVIDTFTPHCLRHTYCTLLFESGVDVVTAKELMGHTDIKTTLEIYTHLSREKAQKDIDKLNNFLTVENFNASQNASQIQKEC